MYSREYRSDFLAKWICASDEFLKRFDRPKAPEFPCAKFIWGRRYTRAYFRRLFEVDGAVESAFLHFICDNIADVYLNGSLVSSEQRDTGVLDISDKLVKGQNLLMIRAYQTATPDSFTSALTGGLRITLVSGETIDVNTDESFENVRFIDFWETEDPADWENDTSFNREVRSQLIVTDLHAIAIKRSCIFRKSFFVDKEPKKATLSATALGCYDARINREAIDDSYFNPSSSDKAKEYRKVDVTHLLKSGENAVSVMLGNGWYNCESWGALLARKPALFMQIELEYEDGSTQTIATDDTWLVNISPLVDNDIQFGERYDARLEIENWDDVGCDEPKWERAEVIAESPFTNLLLQNYPPVRATDFLSVRQVKEFPDKSKLFDCGVNVAGEVEVTVKGAKNGQKVFISVGERLDQNGDVEIGAYVAPYYPQDSAPDGNAPYNLRNLNVYVAKGEAEEHYSPRFCYTGFRYVKISGAEVEAEDIKVRVMHNALDVAGSFESSDKTLSALWEAVKLTWLNNCYNGPTDCPTREKNFWTGDTMIFSHLACWYTDCQSFLARWTDLGRKMTGPYGWEDEEYMMPWTLYRFYGDKGILDVKYKSIKSFVNRRRESAKGELLPINPFSCYNDWLNPTGENLSPDFFSHCWYLHMLDVSSRIAKVMDDNESSELWAEEFRLGKEKFNELYYSYGDGEYCERIQSSAVLPLAFGLVPSGEEQRVADTLHRYLEKNGFKLTTGFQASRFILNVLADHNHGDDAVKLLHQSEFPSWKYMLDSGATNITESWFAMNDPDKSISMCHFSLGASFAWFFEYLGGIRINECAPGFERVVIEPHCFESLGDCKITYKSRYGEIVSEWSFVNGELKWSYTVPEGVEAEVRAPHIYKK